MENYQQWFPKEPEWPIVESASDIRLNQEPLSDNALEVVIQNFIFSLFSNFTPLIQIITSGGGA